MIPRLRRILWKLEDNAGRIVKLCVYVTLLGIFWTLLIYTPFSGAFK